MSNIPILRSQVGTQAKVDIINNDPMGDFYRSVGTTAQQIGDNINKMQQGLQQQAIKKSAHEGEIAISEKIGELKRKYQNDPDGLTAEFKPWQDEFVNGFQDEDLKRRFQVKAEASFQSLLTQNTVGKQRILDDDLKAGVLTNLNNLGNDIAISANGMFSANSQVAQNANVQFNVLLKNHSDALNETFTDGRPVLSASQRVAMASDIKDNAFRNAVLENPQVWQKFQQGQLTINSGIDADGNVASINIRDSMSIEAIAKVEKTIEVQQKALQRQQEKQLKDEYSLLKDTLATTGQVSVKQLIDFREQASIVGNNELFNKVQGLIAGQEAITNLSKLSIDEQQQALTKIREQTISNPSEGALLRFDAIQDAVATNSKLFEKDPLGYYQKQGFINDDKINLADPSLQADPTKLTEMLQKRSFNVQAIKEHHGVELPILNDDELTNLSNSIKGIEQGDITGLTAIEQITQSVMPTQTMALAKQLHKKGHKDLSVVFAMYGSQRPEVANQILQGQSLEKTISKPKFVESLAEKIGKNTKDPAFISKHIDIIRNVYTARAQANNIFDKDIDNDLLESVIEDLAGPNLDVDTGNSTTVFAQQKSDGSFTTANEIENVVDFIKKNPDAFTQITGQTFHSYTGQQLTMDNIVDELSNFEIVNGTANNYEFILRGDDPEQPPIQIYNNKGQPLKLNIEQILNTPQYKAYEAKPTFLSELAGNPADVILQELQVLQELEKIGDTNAINKQKAKITGIEELADKEFNLRGARGMF